MLGWQWVALGTLIILNIVYFQQGIVGWTRERWPELFGMVVEEDGAGPASAEFGEARAGREATR